MTTVIKDGLTGRTARVNDDNQLAVFATQRTQLSEALISGDGYIVTTPSINLTTGTISALLSVSNTNSDTWIISRVFVNAGPSDVVDEHSFQIVYNSTGGTLTSAGTPFLASNLNAGSAKSLSADIFYGAQGSTITGGAVIIDTIVPETGARTSFTEDNFVIPPGTSIQITVTPPVGNTNMNAQCGILLHRESQG